MLMQPPLDKGKCQSGFTLAEIMVMVAIFAVAAAVIIPAAVSTTDFQAISAARMIAADLQYAQDQAITSQEPVTVTFDPATESYGLSNASGSLIHPMTKSVYDIDFRSRRGFGNLDLVSADFDGNKSVTFDELGSPDNAGVITLQAGPHLYRVEIAAATGKVTVAVESS